MFESLSNWFIILYLIMFLGILVGFRTRLRVVLLITPLILGSFAGYYFTAQDNYGYPVRLAQLSQKSNYSIRGYIIEEPKRVYIWLKEEGSTKPRAYQVPYFKKLHEELEKNRDKISKGIPLRIKLNPRKKGQGDEWDDPDLKIYELPDLERLPPKE
jgi:hypothetical protein